MMTTQAENERETLGALLRRTREERGLSFEQAVDATKISPKCLKALEEDDYASLPAEAFVRGFYTIYAGYLALDQDEVRSRYNQQKRHQPKNDEGDAPTPRELALQVGSMAEPSLVTSHSVAGLALLALLLAGIAACWYYSFNPVGYLSHMLRGSGQPATTAGQAAAPAPAIPDQPAAAPAPAPAPSTTPEQPASNPVTAGQADPGGTAATPPVSPATAPSAAPIAADAAGTTASQPPPPATPTEAAPTAVPAPAAYTLRATFKQATRLSVTIDDQPAQHLDFAAGVTHSWRAGRSIILTLPAGTAEMFLNGLPLAQPAKAAGEEITISIPPQPPQ